MSGQSIQRQHDIVTVDYGGGVFRYEIASGWFGCERGGASFGGAVSRFEYFKGGRAVALETGAGGDCRTEERAAGAVSLFVTHAKGDLTLTQEFVFPSGEEYFLMRAGIENRGVAPLEMRGIKPLHIEGGATLRLGGSMQPWSVYNLGFQSWTPAGAVPLHRLQPRPSFRIPHIMSYNPARHTPRNRGRHLCDWLMAIKNTETGHALVCGFATMSDFMSHIYLRTDPREERLLRFNAHCDADRTPLTPGGKTVSEWLYVCLTKNSLAALESYTDAAGRSMNARTERPIPVGWCSWYKYFTKITQQQMLSNLEHVKKLSEDLPITLFQLDDGYQKAVGDWTTLQRDKFPDDLDALARRIRDTGLQPGIWTAPFFARTNSQLYAERKAWFLRDRGGKIVSGGWIPAWGGEMSPLDLTRPDVQQWLFDTFKTIVHEWGFTFLKLDFLYSAVVRGRFNDGASTRARAYRRGLEIIREAAGEDAFLLGCGAPIGPSVGLVDAMRIGPDTGPQWRDPVFRAVVGDRSNPSVESSLVNCITRSFLHGRFWTNDPDCVMLRKGKLTPHEYRTYATVIGLTGGMVLISDDMAELDAEGREVFARLTPPSGTPARPIDLFESAYPRVFAATFPDRTLAAAINWNDSPGRVAVDFAALGLDPDADYLVFDVWNRRFLGALHTDLAFSRIPAHGCRLIALLPKRDEPELLGTTLHITSGGLELKRRDWNPETNTLELEIELPGARQGEIFIHIPECSEKPPEINAIYGEATFKSMKKNVCEIEVNFRDKIELIIKTNP